MVTQTADRADRRTDGRPRPEQKWSLFRVGRKAAKETPQRTELFHFAATPSAPTRLLMYLQTALLYDIVNAVYTKMYFYGSCEKKTCTFERVVYADSERRNTLQLN